jgi:hypothetical protein
LEDAKTYQIAHEAEHTLTHAVLKLSSALIRACPATNSTSTNVQHCGYSSLREKTAIIPLGRDRISEDPFVPSGGRLAEEGRNLDGVNSQRWLTAAAVHLKQGSDGAELKDGTGCAGVLPVSPRWPAWNAITGCLLIGRRL